MRILDTDTCIELLRGNTSVFERRASLVDEVVTTWITACELYFGAARSNAADNNRALVDAFLDSTAVIEPDRKAARTFGELKSLLLSDGEREPDADLFIGAIALSRGATLVTGNTRHFERLPGLLLEDWIRG